jgi:hypothetical protein
MTPWPDARCEGPSGNSCTTLDADASRLHPNAAAESGNPGRAALLVAHMHPVCTLHAPGRTGASTPKMPHVFPDGP